MNETPVDTASLTISAFAQQSRLTLKALRLYDDLGLLHPLSKDPASGYRHYAPSQLPRASRLGIP